MISEYSTLSAAQELAADIDPSQVLVSGPAFDDSLRIWNGAVKNRPSLVVRAETPAGVQAAVHAARRHHLPLSVRGGGHDWAGRALRSGGLVIDLTAMRRVDVDSATSTAIVGGGATAGDVVAVAASHGLTAATGTVRGVGMAGLTLGGGYGPLNGRFGLALDNLLSADVVLADGRLVTADESHEPELYWALRGGGGNFGVVTSMRIRLHAVNRLLAGFIVFPWAQAADVLHRLDVFIADVPDELTVQTAVVSGPDGEPGLILSPAWSGDAAQGEPIIDALQRLGSPVLAQVRQMTYGDMLGLYDAYIATGRHYAIRTRSVAKYSTLVVEALVEAGSSRTSPLSGISIHHFHGAASRVPIDSTAFGIRRDHFVIEILAAWQPDDSDGARHQAWAESVSDALSPTALPGGYANLLGPNAHDQIAFAYGPNASRLCAAKARFDPEGMFSAIPLP